MGSSSNNYIISGGAQGKSRLDVLSKALYPYTLSLLKGLGVGSGCKFLDIGCGGGNITFLAAEMIGHSGVAAGVDFDGRIIELARQTADEQKVSNVSFFAGSIYDLDLPGDYDFAYARFLLSHLQRPADALAKMIGCVKPGGKVIVEDVYFSGHVCYPGYPSFERYVQLYKQAACNNGHDPDIGPSLYSLFLKAGLTNVGFGTILPCFNAGPGKQMAGITLDRIKQALLNQGLAGEEEIDSMLSALDAFAKDEATIMSLPLIFRVWGTRQE